MNETAKRPRLRRIDLETINDALGCYIESLKDQLTKHEEDEARFAEQEEWLQKREKLNWLQTNAKHAQVKIAANLKGAERGRTPEPLRHLLNVTAEDKPGEYIKFLEAMTLLPSRDFETDVNTLFNAIQKGAVNSFIDDEEGVRKVRKLDVLRLAAYLGVHR